VTSDTVQNAPGDLINVLVIPVSNKYTFDYNNKNVKYHVVHLSRNTLHTSQHESATDPTHCQNWEKLLAWCVQYVKMA